MSDLKCCKKCGAFITCTNKGECCPECEYFDPVDSVCMSIKEPKAPVAQIRNVVDDEIEDDTSFLFEDDDEDEDESDKVDDDDSDDDW